MFKPVDNVKRLILKSCNIVGNFESDMFSMDIYNEIEDYKIDSPIEQILYCALKTLQKTNFLPNQNPVEYDKKLFNEGFGITPQVEIGKYRCDFEVFFGSSVLRNNTQMINKKIFVECDSQEFHERTEQERRYEKARDRYIQSQGFKIFHFTGKEILLNPFKIASEIISELTTQQTQDIEDSIVNYNNEN